MDKTTLLKQLNTLAAWLIENSNSGRERIEGYV
jgi:hypothetical protein